MFVHNTCVGESRDIQCTVNYTHINWLSEQSHMLPEYLEYYYFTHNSHEICNLYENIFKLTIEGNRAKLRNVNDELETNTSSNVMISWLKSRKSVKVNADFVKPIHIRRHAIFT